MKLFVITSRIPFPLDKGDKLRIYHQLKELSKQHEIYLCAIKSPLNKEHKLSREVLNEFCEEVYFNRLLPMPSDRKKHFVYSFGLLCALPNQAYDKG